MTKKGQAVQDVVKTQCIQNRITPQHHNQPNALNLRRLHHSQKLPMNVVLDGNSMSFQHFLSKAMKALLKNVIFTNNPLCY